MINPWFRFYHSLFRNLRLIPTLFINIIYIICSLTVADLVIFQSIFKNGFTQDLSYLRTFVILILLICFKMSVFKNALNTLQIRYCLSLRMDNGHYFKKCYHFEKCASTISMWRQHLNSVDSSFVHLSKNCSLFWFILFNP